MRENSLVFNDWSQKMLMSSQGEKQNCQHDNDTGNSKIKNKRIRTRYTIDDVVTSPILLRSTIRKHLNRMDSFLLNFKPSSHTIAAFEETQCFVQNFMQKKKDNALSCGIILDSGCGTARSTLLLGEMFPNDIIIGVDKSLSRLERNSHFRNNTIHTQEEEEESSKESSSSSFSTIHTRIIPNRNNNILLVRADLPNFWKLCFQNHWKLKRHYILYPNPYPKRSRWKSRWYGHPIFPFVVGLGGEIVVRSNWRVYLKEFQVSFELAKDFFFSLEEEGEGDDGLEKNRQEPNEIYYEEGKTVPMTNFERKYFLCGEPVYEVIL